MLEALTPAPYFPGLMSPPFPNPLTIESLAVGGGQHARYKYAALFFPHPKWSLLRRVRIRYRMCRPQRRVEGSDQHLCRHGGRHFQKAQAEFRVAYGIARRVQTTDLPHQDRGRIPGLIAIGAQYRG